MRSQFAGCSVGFVGACNPLVSLSQCAVAFSCGSPSVNQAHDNNSAHPCVFSRIVDMHFMTFSAASRSLSLSLWLVCGCRLHWSRFSCGDSLVARVNSVVIAGCWRWRCLVLVFHLGWFVLSAFPYCPRYGLLVDLLVFTIYATAPAKSRFLPQSVCFSVYYGDVLGCFLSRTASLPFFK